MAENSPIEWCDHTFNPWLGCTKISPACDHCYAESWAKRTGQPHLWDGERRRTSLDNRMLPHRWNRKAQAAGIRSRGFCASLADVFDNQVPYLLRVPAAVRFLSIEPMLGSVNLGCQGAQGLPVYWEGSPEDGPMTVTSWGREIAFIKRRGWVRWSADRTEFVDWIIVGGESGPGARPMHPDWARSIRDQCAAAGVPFLFKQWGEYAPTPDERDSQFWAGADSEIRRVGYGTWASDRGMSRIGKKAAGRLLDGRTHDAFPKAPKTVP